MSGKQLLRIALGALFLVALGSFMVTYQVDFTEKAVLTTFGKASGDGNAKEPGLHLKLPYPFQSVTKYDTRTRFVETRAETQLTSDEKQIIVELFCLWRVTDPLAFFRKFSNAGERADQHFFAAEGLLRDMLRSRAAAVGQFSLTQLFPPDRSPSMLAELEEMMRGGMVEAGAYGLAIEQVGVSRVLLPQETSEAVIQRMQENRNALVSEIESQGQSRAEKIRSEAELLAQTIRSFAEARAQEIRAQGDIEAKEFFAQMDEHPELAVFLKQLDLYREALMKKATLVITGQFPGLTALDPSVMTGLESGEIPNQLFMEQLGAGQDPTDE